MTPRLFRTRHPLYAHKWLVTAGQRPATVQNGVVVVSVVDGLRELEPQLSDDAEIIAQVLPLLLDVVEAAERVSKGVGPRGIVRNAKAEQELDQALAALESAQGADSPETEAGA